MLNSHLSLIPKMSKDSALFFLLQFIIHDQLKKNHQILSFVKWLHKHRKRIWQRPPRAISPPTEKIDFKI